VALVQIPCTPGTDSRWTQRTALDGTDYLLTIYWTQRDGSWRLDLADQDGNPITTGRKLVCNWNLLRGVLGTRASWGVSGVVDTHPPTGILAVVDTLGQGLDPGYSDLGGRCVLLYGQLSDWEGTT
jgi:hypothetical protein